MIFVSCYTVGLAAGMGPSRHSRGARMDKAVGQRYYLACVPWGPDRARHLGLVGRRKLAGLLNLWGLARAVPSVLPPVGLFRQMDSTGHQPSRLKLGLELSLELRQLLAQD